ncbi:type II restriction/modification system, control protein [Campylobacter blaseri]|uniref:Transcriptional regulator n=2 Tax=Campylobacter blaseri TaxID=2042961 RepID=A0A2P8R092_9BACT|nr:helix-turn-helix transcriptional regulator [Campylobacter blaseri]PSM51914.1 transcriptional regulator [Campylobacter blaseri]PSM53698.1 transcriptional regulator [Campylobacter blaseri]QKF85748.1 type II restriction/modification system, control protein [Campylobacter blaseri]
MNLVEIFALNVKFYRQKIGISQEQLAFLCNLHRTYISSVERCERNISLKNIQKIANALGLEPYKLLEPRNCLQARTNDEKK